MSDGDPGLPDTADSATKCTDDAGGSIPGACIDVHGSGLHVGYLRSGVFIPQGETFTGRHRITKDGAAYRLQGSPIQYTAGLGGSTFWWKWNIGQDFPDGTKFCASFKLNDGSLIDGSACATVHA